MENREYNRDSKDQDRYNNDRDEDGKSGRRSFHRKKVCRFCTDQDVVLDYKDVRLMQSFIMDNGKIIPRRITGNCASHQRKTTMALKRARNLALIGFVSSSAQENYFSGR